MPTQLDIQGRESLFVVKEGATTRKLILPRDWPVALVANDEQVYACLLRAAASGQRTFLVLSEEHFLSTLDLVRRRLKREALAHIHLIVVSSDPRNFFSDKTLVPELLSVYAEKDFKKYTEFYLLCSIRHSLRAESRFAVKAGLATLEKLNSIFVELSSERNPQKLLASILKNAVGLVQATAGSLYLVQETDGEMYFKLRMNYDGQGEVQFQHTSTKVTESAVCGYVVLTRKMLNIPNVGELRPLSLPQFNRSMDCLAQPETIALLTHPLRNSRNEIIAVLELSNRQVQTAQDSIAFSADDESLLAAFSTQAATCIENVDLYGDIHRLFEGFIRASITAIESRDPSTAGHSERVAKICVALARATSECQTGIYRSVKFKEEEIRELEYAAMLHDFGKIGVREEVLVKAKKLYPYQLEAVRERIKVCKTAARIVCLEKQLKSGATVERSEHEYHEQLRQLEHFWEVIQQANEPAVLKKEKLEALERLRSEQLFLPDGSTIHILTEDEYEALSVSQGSLTPSERLEIESHVRHTYQFLKMIPWTKDFKHLQEIAYCHHEKLDGSGYPRGLTAHEIPLQSKIMTIADIYDALTAADRWYKEAVPVEKALSILAHEVSLGKLDPVLYELFVERKVFEVTQAKGIHKVA